MKITRRSVIIRQTDWQRRLRPEAAELYTQAHWEPLTLRRMEQENILHMLTQGRPNYPWPMENKPLNKLLYTIKIPLYKAQYLTWHIEQLDGALYIRAPRSNSKPSLLGIATLEYHK